MKAAELLEAIAAKQIKGDFKKNLEIFDIVQDSRAVKPGDLFVCIEGTRVDGHNYAETAVKNGASMILAHKNIQEIAGNTPVVYVKDTTKILSVLARKFYHYPSENLKIIGVTGTNGKTTVTYIVEAIIKAMGKKTGLMGTIEMHIDDAVYPTKNTTSDSLTLQKTMQKMVDAKTEYLTLELSSIALEMGRAWGLDLDVAILTNVTHEHMEFHHTMEAYIEAKKLMFSQLGNSRKKNRLKYAVLNLDDETFKNYSIATPAEVLSYSILNSSADFYADNIRYTKTKTFFDLKANGKSYPVTANLIGSYNVSNTLAALAAVYAAGIPLEHATRAVASLAGVKGRMEPLPEAEDFAVYIDYAHTPDAMEKTLATVKEFTKGRIISVFGCAGDREKEKRPVMAKIGTDMSDLCILTTDDSYSEDPQAIIDDMIAGLENDNYEIIIDRRKAIFHAIGKAEPGDTVLLLGRGHETDYIHNYKTIRLVDGEIALEAIRHRG